MWYTWPSERKIWNARGVFATATQKGVSIYLVDPLFEGVIGPLLQRSGRPFWEALDQPIKTPGRLDPSSTLGVHNWWAILIYRNRDTKWLANTNSIFVIFKIVLFCLIFLGVRWYEEGRPTPVMKLPPPKKNLTIYGLLGPRPGICIQDARKQLWTSVNQKVLKVAIFYKP